MPGPGKAFLSIGVAENLGVKIGDTVTLTDPDMRQLTVEVAAIYHNSVQNYAIVEPETVEAQWGSLPGKQMAFVRLEVYSDHHEAGALAAEQSGVMNVIVTDDIAGQVSSMLGALDAVVLTIIICAGALAMIVLYNLTNINITERIREIATIKVLGFHAKETAAYVFKENLLLSAMGMIVGLGGGWLLLKFVMNEIRVDLVWFTPMLEIGSILLGMAMTMLAACIVDFLLYFKLEKINMAEALKSVE
jgi:putative ABC transport system permease protein